jgi:hypothetical protein
MLIFSVVAGFGLFLWIAATLARIHSTLSAVRRNYFDPLRTDMKYPAFSRDQIDHAYVQLNRALDESIVAEKRLFTSPGWKDITTGGKSPDSREEDLMRKCAFSTLWWEAMLARCQFLTEANLRVCRGDWTIAEARYYYRELEASPSAMQKEVEKGLQAWRSRFRQKEYFDQEMRGYNEETRPHEAARAEFLAEWKSRFKIMHEPKPIYMHQTASGSDTESVAGAS